LRYSELRRLARISLRGRWGLAIGSLLLYVFMLAPISFITLLLSLGGISESVLQWIDLLDYAWGILFTGVFILGFYCIYLRIARGEETSIRHLFTYLRSRKLVLRAFLAFWLQAIYTFLWTLLLIIPGIIKGYAYSMTYFILIDHPELTVNQAITKSRQMMAGHKWQLFVLNLTFIGWALLCILTLGIGFLWLPSYIQTSISQFYLKIRESN
jgi:uncharacterized membrane protein